MTYLAYFALSFAGGALAGGMVALVVMRRAAAGMIRKFEGGALPRSMPDAEARQAARDREIMRVVAKSIDQFERSRLPQAVGRIERDPRRRG